MNSLEYVFGQICSIILPIPEKVYYGNKNASIAICTLASISLLKEISNHNLEGVAITGRLFSENTGIDTLVRHVNSNKNIKTIILCGKEVWGHKAGSSLVALYKNGIDNNNRIVHSQSPNPILTINQKQVKQFQNQIKIINKIGETSPDVIMNLVCSMR